MMYNLVNADAYEQYRARAERHISKKRKWKPPQKPTKSDNKEPKVKKSKTDANLEDLALQLLQR